MPTTTRLQIPTPVGADANDIPGDLQALADQVDAVAGGFTSGLYAALPAANAAHARWIYEATDARALFRCDGATWFPVGDVAVMTTAQRDLLVAGGKWNGRVIYNSTLARAQLWNGSAWVPVVDAFVGVKLRRTTAQSIPNTTSTAVLFDSEDVDTDGLHSTVSNTSRITIPAGFSGKWLIVAAIGFAANATGSRTANYNKNGGDIVREYSQLPSAGASDPTHWTYTSQLDLVAGDYVELLLLQNSGGALNTVADRTTVSASFQGA